MNPPNAGPNMEPKATKEPDIPKAFPLSLGGKTSVIIPWLVDINIAAPIACTTLDNTRIGSDGDIPQRKDPRTNIKIPFINTELFECISPNLPKIKIDAEIIIKYELTIHSVPAIVAPSSF